MEGLGQIKDYPLSDADIRKILPGIKIITYSDLAHHEKLPFDKKGRLIMLYQTFSATSGHWIAILRQKGRILYFDPYGEKPEMPLKTLSEEEREAYGEEEPYLTKLLCASGLPVYYNTHPYQKDKKDVNTCGRWAVARALYAPKDDEYFKKVVDASGMSGDDFVSALTANWLKK
jgi:hypothetical protein